MDIKQLDNFLFELTQHEKNYQQNPFIQAFSDRMPRFNYQGKDIFYLNTSLANNFRQLPFFIRKQSRFVPVPEHIHDTIEINYVYHGSYTQVINGQQLTLKQGDLIIIDTGIPHQTDALGTDDIIISMLIKQDFFTKYFYTELAPDTLLSKFILRAISESNNHNQYLFFRSNHFQKLHYFFQELLCEYYSSEPLPFSENYLTNYLKLIFLELIRYYSVEDNGTTNANQQFMFDVMNYIDQNYKNCHLNQCANQLNYNSSYLSQHIKESTVKNFKTLVQEKRLSISLVLLQQTQKSIRDIALDVGFSNLNQFYKVFKKQYHMTPAEYRIKK